MAYSLKGLNDTLLYELYQVHIGAAPVKMNGIQSLGIGSQGEYFMPASLGNLIGQFKSLNNAPANMALDTLGVGQIIALGATMPGSHLFTGSSGTDVLVAYLAAKNPLGVISNAGVAYTVPRGVLYLSSLVAQQDALAVASCIIYPSLLAGNPIWQRDDVSSLSSTAGAISADDECWTLGPITIDNVDSALLVGMSISNLPYRQIRTKGSAFNEFGYVGHGEIIVTIDLESPISLVDLDAIGIRPFGSTGNTASTSCVINLQRCNASGARRAAGDGDINITVNRGAICALQSQGQTVGHMATQLEITAFADGTNAPLTWVRNADA